MANEKTALLSGHGPAASFARALEIPQSSSSSSSSSLPSSPSPLQQNLPQAIGHRGYKAAFPENSMAAFRGAVACGAHAIETDLHLSRDGVVVLTHDPSLKRCFGVDKRVASCDWDYLSTLRTTKEPHVELARLSDLLRYLGAEENERIWVLLDIKMDDAAEDLLTKTAETLASTPTTRPWRERVILGGWNENYIRLCHKLLPGYPVACIAFSALTARRFLHGAEFAHVDFNILCKALVGPIGGRFRAAARRAGRNLFTWTVNDEAWMEWSIQKGMDGVITDDPKLFLEVCRRSANEGGGGGGDSSKGNTATTQAVAGQTRAGGPALPTARMYLGAVAVQVLTTFLLAIFWRWLSRKGRSKKTPRGQKGPADEEEQEGVAATMPSGHE